jgi:hypothetical protein
MATLSQTILADLASIFAGDLAVNATHINGATNETLRVLFNNPHQIGLEGWGEISSSGPAIEIQTADLTNVDRASTFTISGTVYYVIEIQPDQDGVTTILLSEDQQG